MATLESGEPDSNSNFSCYISESSMTWTNLARKKHMLKTVVDVMHPSESDVIEIEIGETTLSRHLSLQHPKIRGNSCQTRYQKWERMYFSLRLQIIRVLTLEEATGYKGRLQKVILRMEPKDDDSLNESVDIERLLCISVVTCSTNWCEGHNVLV